MNKTQTSELPKIKDKLGMTLLNQGLVSREVIEKALLVSEKEKANLKPPFDRRNIRSLPAILHQDFKVDHNLIYRTVASLYGFREINLADVDLNPQRLEFIKQIFDPLPDKIKDYMTKNHIVALRWDKDRSYRLDLIAADPTDRMIPEIVRALGVKSYEVYYSQKDDIQKLMEQAFPPENVFLKELEAGDIELHHDELDEQAIDEESIEAEINKSLLVNLVEGMLIEGVRMDASDIHVRPVDEKTTDIFMRFDGSLQLWHKQTGVRPESVAAVVKDRSKNIDRFERDKAQDGFIQRKIDGYTIRYRVSVIPIVGREYTHKFESIVIRILDDRKVITDLDILGFQGQAKEFFVKAISKPQGMVIITGPTGSGKSTTLIAALAYIMRPEINVLTVEDPVEYVVEGARQLKINPKMDFELALRSVLRHDPDVVMVGEIRDRESGEIAIKLANTGHLTFATLHTNDAPSAVSRMFKMGIETFLIAYAINIIIAQRLVRILCPVCKAPVKDLDPALPLRLGFTEEEIKDVTFYKPVGCEHCRNGYKGRAAIHEALFFSKDIRRIIFTAKGDIDEEAVKNQAVADGMLTLRAAARERAKLGMTSLEEVAAVTAED